MPKGEITDSYLCNTNNQIFFKDPLNLDLNPRFFRSKMVQICCLHDLKDGVEMEGGDKGMVRMIMKAPFAIRRFHLPVKIRRPPPPTSVQEISNDS
ncbi:hypothetical protein D5086_025632 [Populus alba]|uniref:Uncharacterized protein n=1 Tax=Populus alba TaxID=43335 RepID=A0ACC4B1H8_POPAL